MSANAKASHILFSKTISVYAIFNGQSFNGVRFEQMGPGKQRRSRISCLPGKMAENLPIIRSPPEALFLYSLCF